MNNSTEFNRHEIFTDVQMNQVHKVITLLRETEDEFGLTNMVYGLYDGVLYHGILLVAMEYSPEIYETVLDVYRFIMEEVEYGECSRAQ